MGTALRRFALMITSIAVAVGAFAQEPLLPKGNWQSATSDSYISPLHPVVTGAEFYLNIDIASDGSFRGEWSEYACSSSVGAYGYLTHPCNRSGKHGRASGKFASGGKGTIELEKLGLSAFIWNGSAAGELALDLPKNWHGDQVLWRARLTRNGIRKPANAMPSPPDAGLPVPSAVALYREFNQDEKGALARYKDKTLVLEGRRGTLIETSDGGAAIHIADGFRSRALVLSFQSLGEVRGIGEGAQFRFRCTVKHFDYLYVYMDECSIVR